jgi:hypothetical protein
MWTMALAVTWQGEVRASDEGHEASSEALHRLELRPYGGWAAAANSVVGPFVGADATFRVHRRWALGVDAAWYSPFEAAPSATGARYPLNETTWSASIDGAFFPWVARSGEGPAAGSLEAFVLVGVGLAATRPIAVVDPSRRFSADNHLLQLDAGIGARVYANRALAVTLELRDLVYFDKVENGHVADGQGLPPNDPRNPANPNTWYSPSSRLSSCIELRLGVSFLVL